MTAEQSISLGRWTAAISFVIGTVILGLFYFDAPGDLPAAGVLFMALATVVDLGVLVVLLIKAIAHKGDRRKLLATCGVMLLNIPVALLYSWLGIMLLAERLD